MEDEEKSEENVIRSRILSGGGRFLLSNVAAKAFGFGFMLVAARFLGPAQFGVLVLGMSVMHLAGKIAAFGLPNTIQRFLAGQFTSEKEKYYGTILLFATTSSSLAVFALFVGAPSVAESFFDEPALTSTLRILAAGVLPFITFLVGKAVLQAREHAGEVAIADAVGGASKLGIAFLLFWLIATSDVGAWVLVASYAIGSLTAWYFVRMNEAQPDFTVDLSRFKRIGSYSVPLVVVGLGFYVSQQADRFMLGWLSTSSDVGMYTAASTLALLMTISMRSLGQIFMPMASESYEKKDHESLAQSFLTVTRWSSLAGTGCFLVFCGGGLWVLRLYGAEYATPTAYWTLLIISGLYLVVTLVGPTSVLLQMTDYHRVESINTVLFVVANIGLNYLFIPWFGILGAALATSLSGILRNIIQLVEVYRWLNIQPIGRITLGFSTLSILGVGVVLATSPGSLTALVASVALLLATVGLFLWSASKEELGLLRSTFRTLTASL
jgi:O-antigen/teichoic acid export membrane protein